MTAEPGARVLAFSNLFGIATGDEPVSMLHGVVTSVAPLEARRGAFTTSYRGEIYVVDAAANNPGAAGGALTDSQGRLLGMLGKELRSSLTGTWLNYALPISSFSATVDDILAGRFTPPDLTEADQPESPLTPAALGIVLVPDVVVRTPPYVDRVLPDSPAARAGLRPDDLLVMVNGIVATSCRDAVGLLQRLESDATVRIAALRGEELIEVSLSSNSSSPTEVEDSQ
jgi:serine protease Do